MFLGNDYTFQSLSAFVTGYLLAAREQQLEQTGSPNFSYFSDWLLGHIDENYGRSGGWHWQIINRNNNDDNKAFDDFFYLLGIFKTSVISTQLAIVSTQAQNFSINGPVSRYPFAKPDERYGPPYAIRWASITNSTAVWVEFLDENNVVFTENRYLNAADATAALEQEFGGYLKMP